MQQNRETLDGDERKAYANQNAIPKAARYGVLHDLARHRSSTAMAMAMKKPIS